MPWEQGKPIAPGAACTNCGLRYRQRAGLCAVCFRQISGETRSILALESQERLAKEIAIAELNRATPERPRRELIVNGQVFEVVFDGS